MTRFAKEKVKRKLAQLLLAAEALLVTGQYVSSSSSIPTSSLNGVGNSNMVPTCSRCFQLMAIDVILNSKLEPFVIDVNTQPNMRLETLSNKDGYVGKEGKRLESSVRKAVVSDSLTLISADESVASDVTDALEEVVTANVIGIMGVSCQISHELCLGDRDLTYLIDSRREDLNRGGFEKLYPCPEMGVHKQLLDEIVSHSSWTGNNLNKIPGNGLVVHRTADLHPLLKNLELFYYRHLIGSSEEVDTVSKSVIPQDLSHGQNWTLFHKEHQCSEGTSPSRQSLHPFSSLPIVSFFGKPQVCVQSNVYFLLFLRPCLFALNTLKTGKRNVEPQTLPFIESIGIEPPIILSPTVSPHITTYDGNASFETILITISAKSLNCQTEVRSDGKYGSSRYVILFPFFCFKKCNAHIQTYSLIT